MAHEQLRAGGQVIEEITYGDSDLAVEALARGDADFGNGALSVAWTAAARGAPVRTVMEYTANLHRLVAVRGIRACGDLDGRRVALQGQNAAGTVLLRAYLAEECPGVQVDAIFVQGSGNRAAAFLAGGIDAAALELDAWDWLDERAPGRFHVLADFAARWPSVKTMGVQTNADFAARRPDLVTAYIGARLAAHREALGDVDRLAREAGRVLGPSDRWVPVARTFVGARAWAPDGGLREEDVAGTLAFFSNDTLRQASPDQVADLSFLRTALAAAER
jgi:ABC-type nitrate/sulfonate/bicarbonate transport system substrate-binding protein